MADQPVREDAGVARVGDPTRRKLVTPGARISLLSVAIVTASGLAWAGGLLESSSPVGPISIPLWALALACIAAELFSFHIEINHEAHTFTFSEVPMALGLCLAAPAVLIGARLIGGIAVLVGRERQRPVKLLFNLSMYLGECCLAIVVFLSLRGSAPVTAPRVWLATAVAIFAADALSIICVACAIRWHGAEPRPLQLLLAGTITASANTSLGLAAALLLATNVAAIGLLAVVAGVLLLAYRAYSSLAQRHESLQLFYDFTKSVGGSLRAGSAIEAILEKARELLRADVATIALFTDPPGRQVIRVESRAGDMTTTPAKELIDVTWLANLVLDRGTVVAIARGSDDPDEQGYLTSIDARDVMVAPLQGKAGVIGVITVADRVGEVSSFDAESARLFETLAAHASVALENGRLIDELNREVEEREHQALHDSLTGLPNRVCFFERVVATIVSPAVPFSILLMDLDGFKDINDTLGHASGDLVLQAFARRLTAAAPDGATVARLGGDEFAVLLPRAGSEAVAVAAARQFHASLDEPVEVEGVAIEARCSIGIARWPEHANDEQSLVKCADVAMYAAKTAIGRIESYDSTRDEHTLKRLTLGAQLRGAIADRDLLVHYQPKVRMSDGVTVGVEALVRWHHPEHGMMPPDEFITVAERTGSIGALTEFVLRTALEQCHEWRRNGHELTVAVNLSVRSLLDTDLPAQIERLLALTSTQPEWLTLEVTESGIMDPRRGLAALEAITALGVKLSIDDFGTGYSSLAYLARLPVDELKIDKSFVMAMGTEASSAMIVHTIVDLGESLNLNVVAEGIEDRMAWDTLRAAGCHTGQGYYISKPVPAETLERWLETTRGAGIPTLGVVGASRIGRLGNSFG